MSDIKFDRENSSEPVNRNGVYTRIPGLLWLAMAAGGGFGLFYVRSRVIVLNDAAATVANLRADEFTFRCAVLSLLIGQVLAVFFAVELFRLFAPAGRRLSMILMLTLLLSAIFTVVNTGNHFASMMLLSQSEYLKGFSAEQINSACYAFLRFANGPGQGLIELFWPVTYLSFGLLILRSRIVPSVFGYLLVVTSFGFTINLLDKYLTPTFYPAEATMAAQLVAALTILPTMLWFLIRGVPQYAGCSS